MLKKRSGEGEKKKNGEEIERLTRTRSFNGGRKAHRSAKTNTKIKPGVKVKGSNCVPRLWGGNVARE